MSAAHGAGGAASAAKRLAMLRFASDTFDRVAAIAMATGLQAAKLRRVEENRVRLVRLVLLEDARARLEREMQGVQGDGSEEAERGGALGNAPMSVNLDAEETHPTDDRSSVG